MPVQPAKTINCNACGKFVSPGSAAKCTRCSTSYHRACVNIPSSAEIVADWLCPVCKSKIPKGDKTSTPVKGISEDYVQKKVGSGPKQPPVVQVSDGVNTESERGAAALDGSLLSGTELGLQIRDEIRALHSHFALLREDFHKLLVSVESTNKRIDGLESRIVILESRAEVHMECAKHGALEQAVAGLKRDLNDRDQELLSSDVEISNLPELQGENLVHTMALLAAKIGSPVDERDIVFVERVGARVPAGAGSGARERRVVMRLTRRGLRDDLIRAARVRRTTTTADLGMSVPAQRFYLNERLTRQNKSLLFKTKQICRRLFWKFVWTRQGKIFARQSDGTVVQRIHSDEDLVRVFGVDAVRYDETH